jgi:hypothetical protein
VSCPDTHAPAARRCAFALALQEDSDTLNKVQERFDVEIKPLPASIDTSTYMNQS